jgi:hypothetical protein
MRTAQFAVLRSAPLPYERTNEVVGACLWHLLLQECLTCELYRGAFPLTGSIATHLSLRESSRNV